MLVVPVLLSVEADAFQPAPRQCGDLSWIFTQGLRFGGKRLSSYGGVPLQVDLIALSENSSVNLITSHLSFLVPKPDQGLHFRSRIEEIKVVRQEYLLLSDQQSLRHNVTQLSKKLVLSDRDRDRALELVNCLIFAHGLVGLELPVEFESGLFIDAKKGIKRRRVTDPLDVHFGSL